MAAKEKTSKKKDNWFKRHKVWTVMIGIFLFFLLLGIFTSEPPETQTSTEPQPQAQQQGDGVQIADKANGYRFDDRADKQERDVEIVPGEAALIDGMKMAAVKIEKKQSFGEYSQAGNGKVYVILDVAFENTSDKTQSYNSSEFRIQTVGGQVIDSSYSSDLPNQLEYGDLVTGGKVTGQVLFEVPVESGNQYIIWKPGFDPDRAIIQVKP